MFPDLFSIGFLHLKTYGFMMAIGFLVGWQIIVWLCKRTGRNPDPFCNLVMLMMVSGVVGSRIAYVIEHWSAEFAANPMNVIRVDQGGLMFYGGLILSMVVFFTWCYVKKEKVVELADLLSCVIPISHMFGRIGCFFYGCCYGRLSDSPCAVCFPRSSPAWYEQMRDGLIKHDAQHALPVLPTQLFEAGCLLVLFCILFYLYRRFWNRFPGLTTGAYMIGYAVIRFFIEYMRGDPRAAVGPFSISQSISLALCALGILFVSIAFYRKKL